MSRSTQRPRGAADRRHATRGAAMIVVLAIMIILLAIALTFYSVSRVEFNTSTNVINSVRSDLQADAALEIAIATLNEDFLRNPQATSTDHAWRSYFSGAWAAGKTWLTRGGQPLHGGGIAQINLYDLERRIGGALGQANLQLMVELSDLRVERLFRGPETRGWLYIPRLQRNEIVLYDPGARVFYLQRAGNTLVKQFIFESNSGVPPGTVDNGQQINQILANGGWPERFVHLADPSIADRRHPFVTSDLYGRVDDPDTGGPWFPVPPTDPDGGRQYPIEQVHTWADIDNDGDGFRDSMWFPIQADLFFPDDGVDNDLSGFPDDKPNEAAPFVYYGMGSRYGFGDGRDNDGDGIVDNEYVIDASGRQVSRLFLTVPLPGLKIQIDLNNDGLLDERDLVEGQPVYVVLPDTINVTVLDPETGVPINYALTAADVDQIDNDFNGEVNEVDAYAYIGPHNNPLPGFYPPQQADASGNTFDYAGWLPPGEGIDWSNAFYANARERGFVDINVDAYVRQGNIDIVPAGIPAVPGAHPGTQFLQAPNALRVTVSGEPVCELVGRAAVHIADESAKINANVAHALTYRDQPDPLRAERLLTRAQADGAGPHEIDLRLVPGMGVAIPKRIAAARYGAPGGLALPLGATEAALTDPATAPVAGQYFFDVSLPGLGRVDDNGNSLLLALDGRNNSGLRYNRRSLADVGLFLPRLTGNARDALFNPAAFGELLEAERSDALAEIVSSGYLDYYRRIGVFEGIDDPTEFRRFRAARNPLAEQFGQRPGDFGNTAPAPVGTLGDAPYQSYDEIQTRVGQFGEGLADRYRNILGVHSTDRNVRFLEQGEGLRALNQIDFNRAPAQQIAQHLIQAGTLPPATGIAAGDGSPLVGVVDSASRANTHGFAEGLRQADTAFFAPVVAPLGGGILRAVDSGGFVVPTAPEFPADPLLQAMLTAVNLVDARDPGHVRTVLRTENFDVLPGVVDQTRFALPGGDPNRLYTAPWPPTRDALHPRERIPDEELFALEDIEEYFRTPLGLTSDRGEIRALDASGLLSAFAGGGLQRLQGLDAWWANFVTAAQTLPSDGATVAEQRVISYAAAGAESIRINELMVRPVRRVEAEAVTFPEPVPSASITPSTLEPIIGTLGTPEIRNSFRPSPFDAAGAPLPLPTFDVGRAVLGDLFESQIPLGGDQLTEGSAWRLSGNYLRTTPAEFAANPSLQPLLAMGDTAHFVADPSFGFTSAVDLDLTGTAPLPDVIEFSFASTAPAGFTNEFDGLPAGRYYLTLNIADEFGDASTAPTPDPSGPAYAPFETGSPESNIYYSIKYVYTGPIPDISPGVPDPVYVAASQPVLTDIEQYFRLAQSDPTTFGPSYYQFMQTFFKGVPTQHFSLGGFGERAGWVFMDGTPQTARADYDTYAPPPGFERPGAYFAEMSETASGSYILPADNGSAFPLYSPSLAVPLGSFFGGLTHTVYVPPADSNWRLHVAVCSPDPNLKINFFDFSQEPSHEWVELANISEDVVDLGGWEFEVGIPDAPNVPVDPFKSRWRVPNGTQIAPGGFLLLAFNKFDYFQQDRAFGLPGITSLDGADAESLVFNNGMGLAAGLPNLDAGVPNLTALLDITEPPIGALAPLAANDAYANLMSDPRYSDPTGSVFRREFDAGFGKDTYVDFVDNDGDGVTSAYLLGSGLPDTDNAAVAREYPGAPGTEGLQPWNRIVQLECLQLAVTPKELAGGAQNWYDGTPYTMADLNSLDPDGINKLARLVLRGGVLPNYPEHDGIDNDGDGASASNFTYEPLIDPDTGNVLGDALVGLDFLPGILDRDLIDNNLDGYADPIQVAVDFDGNGVPRFHGPTPLEDGLTVLPARNELPNPFLSEGVDEGGNDLGLPDFTRQQLSPAGDIVGRRFAAAGSYEQTPLPVRFLSDRGVQQNRVQDVLDAAASIDPINNLAVLVDQGGNANALRQAGTPDGFLLNPDATPAFAFDLRPGFGLSDNGLLAFLGNVAYTNNVFAGNEFQGPLHPITRAPQGGNAPYLGDPNDPLEWTAFVERRWNPGDNVIVTLYAGQARPDNVADRVTYREMDVINRTVDDGFASEYRAWQFDTTSGNYITNGQPLVLNDNYASLWLPDHMGLDFYRSLERKDPFYAGDRFGTSNRWEATDGAYDDWAESLNFADLVFASFSGNLTAWEAGRVAAARFDLPDRRRLLGHAIHGSPLRMNTPHRLRANPEDLPAVLAAGTNAFDSEKTLGATGRPLRQFPALERHVLAGALVDNPDNSLRRATVANRAFQSTADTLRVPLVTHTHLLRPGVPIQGEGLRLPWPLNPVNFRSARDPDRLFLGGSPTLHFDPTLRGGLAGADLDSPTGEAVFAAVVDGSAMDTVVLTVGQAEFRPIRPDLATLTPASLAWLDPTGTEPGRTPPGAWMPVHLLELPGDPGQAFYPRFANGQDPAQPYQPEYLFNSDFLANRGAAPFGDIFGIGAVNAAYNAGINAGDLAARWPLDKRAVAYVAAARGTTTPELPEGLFIWDAEDGLENGEYTVHIGTFLPGLNERAGRIHRDLREIVGINEPGLRIDPYPEPLLTEFGIRDFIRLDPAEDAEDFLLGGTLSPSRRKFAPRFVVEIITEPSQAQGVKPRAGSTGGELGTLPGLTHPDDWFAGSGDAFALEPGPDGYILYGSGGGGNWRGARVNVTKNFLALRVRQVGANNEVGILTHLVLSPRKRTPGRINVNTVENRVMRGGPANNPDARELFNPLMGVPGVFDVLTTVRGTNGLLGLPYDDSDDGDPVTYVVNQANPADNHWPAPTTFTTWDDDGRSFHNMPPEVYLGNVDQPDRLADRAAVLVGGVPQPVPTAREVAALRMSALMMAGRTKQPDGRYYTGLADLVRPNNRFQHPNPLSPLPPAGTNVFDVADWVDSMRLSPLSNAPTAQQRLDESLERFGRMRASITTRSDVFEIQVTVQSGYAADINTDGVIDYRGNEEFITTGEKKARMVYERRAPADRADDPVASGSRQ